MKNLIAVFLVALALGLALVGPMVAQDAPSEANTTAPGDSDAIKPVKHDFIVRRLTQPVPFSLPQQERTGLMRFQDNSFPAVLMLGSLRLISEVNARPVGQDVYYRTYQRPRITLFGWQPMISVRKNRYTHQYGFKLGVRKFF